MRATLRGLHKNAWVYVKGAGKHAKGEISREPIEGATHIHMRCGYNGGEHLVPIEKVRVVKTLRLKKGA